MPFASGGQIDVEAVATAARTCPSVVGLTGGVMGEVATYLPGRRVTGVRLRDGTLEVHVVARWVPSLPAVGDEVRAAVRPLVGTLPITVFIDDVADDNPADDLAATVAADPDGSYGR